MSKTIIFYLDHKDDFLDNFSLTLKKEFNEFEIIAQRDTNLILSKIKNALSLSYNIPLIFIGEKLLHVYGEDFFKDIKKLLAKTNIILLSSLKKIEKISSDFKNIGLYNYITKKSLESNLIMTVNDAINNYTMNVQLENSYKRDSLTNLLNSNTLLNDISETKNPTLLLMNIDNFRQINATYGYKNGNKILKMLASLLNLRNLDNNLYRLISDEFVFLFDSKDEKTIHNIASDIQEELRTTDFILNGSHQINITLSMSISSGEKNIIENAQTAIYETLKYSPNTISYAKDIIKIKDNSFSVDNLIEAIEKDNVVPFYQGIRNNKTGKITKYECLVRIKCDNGTFIPPNIFLSLANSVGLLTKITKIMIQKSFENFSHTNHEFNINITEDDFKENYLVKFIEENALRYRIDLKNVTFEILENINIEYSTSVPDQIKQIKALGSKIAFDDFGSEKSNFSRLLDLNIDIVKIDGMFIKNIHKDEKSFKLAKAITNLAKDFGCEVVAECVENEEAQKIIEELNIDYTQGFYYSKPSQYIE